MNFRFANKLTNPGIHQLHLDTGSSGLAVISGGGLQFNSKPDA
jgi:hypothetical protein